MFSNYIIAVCILGNNKFFSANSIINFFCLIMKCNSNSTCNGVKWHVNNSTYENGTIFDSNTSIATLVVDSSTIENGTTVMCQATANGHVVESSKPIIVILQGALKDGETLFFIMMD